MLTSLSSIKNKTIKNELHSTPSNQRLHDYTQTHQTSFPCEAMASSMDATSSEQAYKIELANETAKTCKAEFTKFVQYHAHRTIPRLTFPRRRKMDATLKWKLLQKSLSQLMKWEKGSGLLKRRH